MKTLSLRLQDVVFLETESIISKTQIARNKYINEAVAYYNTLQKEKLLAQQLEKESKLVQAESMNVLKEFENLRDEDTAF